MRTRSDLSSGIAAAVFMATALASFRAGAQELNDTWADGNRTSTNLPTDSPTWIGQTGGSSSVSPGSLNFVLPANSLKAWEYFTSDHSAPNGNQPHNAVTHLNPPNQFDAGDAMVVSATFTVSGSTASSTAKNFSIGLFFDPTNPRVQSDIDNESGGPQNPWSDAMGYALKFPVNNSSTGPNPLQLEKRTNGTVTSLLGDNAAYTLAPAGGAAFHIADNISYTVRLELDVSSATRMLVTASISQGNTTLSTFSCWDTGTKFGGMANNGSQPGSTGIYQDFDQLFVRSADNSEMTGLRFTNWFAFHEVFIHNPYISGDLNLDGQVDAADIPIMTNALSDLSKYKQQYLGSSSADPDLLQVADTNTDGRVDNEDLQALLSEIANNPFGAGNLIAVPEPTSLCLVFIGVVALVLPHLNVARRPPASTINRSG